MTAEETAKKIRIALIDDHTLFRSGLKALLTRQSDFEIVGEAADGLEGVKLVEQIKPDIVLLDLDMPTMSGNEALAQILETDPSMKVLMLTVSEDGDDLAECMRLGAVGYLLKKIDADFLLQSIRHAVAGDSVISPEMTSKLVMKLRNDTYRASSASADIENVRRWPGLPAAFPTRKSPVRWIWPNRRLKCMCRACFASSTSRAVCRRPYLPWSTISTSFKRSFDRLLASFV